MSEAVGFDLDMTLVDSSPGIVETQRRVFAEIGIEVTREMVWPYIGIPLETTVTALAPALGEADAAAVVARYRELYPQVGVPLTELLPGVAETVAAVRASGMRFVVVSAKVQRAVELVLARVGLDAGDLAPDEVRGGLFAAGKGTALREFGVTVYVGDHPGDIEAARAAGATAVAVATGPHSAQALAAGAPDVVLADLRAFPAWLAGREAAENGQVRSGRRG